jgi:hypothetical protein
LLRAAGLGAAGALVGGLKQRAAAADPANTTLIYLPGSSIKLEQIIGDVDYAALARGSSLPVAGQTVSRYNVAGTDLGASFEHQGRLYFLFGDTISNDPSMPWSTSSAPFVEYHAGDVIGWSASADPDAGLLLNLLTNGDGSPYFVQPPGLAMGPYDTPNAGISLNGQIYVVCNTGSDVSNPSNPHLNDYSVLTRFDADAQAFATGRTISGMPGGHFIITSLHSMPPIAVTSPHNVLPASLTAEAAVVMFGLGAYRATDVYLALIPLSGFESGAGTSYFAGVDAQGRPAWSGREADAVPVVRDAVTPPTIGNVSVIYSSGLALWLMTYDGGRARESTSGIYFCYAPAPWGPWSAPQIIFNPVRDKAAGDFISDYDPRRPDIAGTPAGPTIGMNDIYRTRGGDYAPYMIERFTRVQSNMLTISYTLSTWNPYTPVRMRSQFQIAAAP